MHTGYTKEQDEWVYGKRYIKSSGHCVLCKNIMKQIFLQITQSDYYLDVGHMDQDMFLQMTGLGKTLSTVQTGIAVSCSLGNSGWAIHVLVADEVNR